MPRISPSLGLVALGAAATVLAWIDTALASTPQVPEPGSLALLSAGIAAVAVGSRWFRRK